MTLFDMIQEEKATETVAATPAQKPASDNADFLIINDDTPAKPIVSQEPVISETKAEDSWLSFSLFWDSTPAQETKQELSAVISEGLIIEDNTTESLEIKDEPQIMSEASALDLDSWISFISEENVSSVTEEITTGAIAEVETKEEWISFIEDAVEVVAEEKPTFIQEEKVEDVANTNPNEYIERTIADLEKWRAWQWALKQERTDKIDDIAKQISSLKEESKKLSDEVKKITEEENKTDKVIEVLKAQKI